MMESLDGSLRVDSGGREFQARVHFYAGQFLSALPSFPPPPILSHHLGGVSRLTVRSYEVLRETFLNFNDN